MHYTKNRRSGFTIVELLIVIVIIAILAAITIVAYNGVQKRAENTKTITAANQTIKLLSMYKSLNGSYPSGFTYACVGDYPNNVCQSFTSTGTMEVGEQDAFKTAIATVGTMPQPSTVFSTTASGRTAAGVYYRANVQDVVYRLNGTDAECAAGGTKTTDSPTTFCIYQLPQ